MPIFSSKNNLIIDLGTGYIKALSFYKNGTGNVTTGYARALINQDTLFKSNYFSPDAIKEGFDLILKGLNKKAFSDFSKTYFILSPEYIKETIISVKIKRNHPEQKISQSELEQIKKKASKLAQDIILEKKEFDEIQFLKFSIFSFKIDGYQIPKILGYTGQEIELTMFCVFSINNYYKKAKNFIESQKLTNYQIIWQGEYVLKIATDFNNKSFALIDAGDRLTRIYLCNNGYITKITEIPFGGNKITKDISSHLNIKPLEAQAIKEKFFLTQLSQELKGEIGSVLSQLEKLFLIELEHNADFNVKTIDNIAVFGGTSIFAKNALANYGVADKIYKIEFKNISIQKEILADGQYHNTLLICNYEN
jgi:cell division ATPase FtsA